jgi:hypothetical protein
MFDTLLSDNAASAPTQGSSDHASIAVGGAPLSAF